jgi:hypothetical protein
MSRRNPVKLPFNPNMMTVQEIKLAAHTLRGLLRDFDAFKDDPEEFALRVLQVRDSFDIN